MVGGNDGMLKEMRDDIKEVLKSQSAHSQWIKDHIATTEVQDTRLNSHSKSINWLKVKIYIGLSIMPIIYTLYRFKIITLTGEH